MNIFTTLLIEPLTNGLILFYKALGGNMGLAIIGFSLFLRVILNPLTKPYMDSMKRMKDLAPRIEKLKAKHKDDKAGFTSAQAELYKQEKFNPGAGCLPYILQIVVLIAFFNVFTRTLSPDGDIAGRFNELLYEPLKFASGAVVNTKFLYFDITKPDASNPIIFSKDDGALCIRRGEACKKDQGGSRRYFGFYAEKYDLYISTFNGNFWTEISFGTSSLLVSFFVDSGLPTV